MQALKTPKNEPEKPLISKRPTDARDAREVARKLIKSGAIQAIQKTKPDPVAFKRPKERKKLLHESNVPYQPFSKPESEMPAKPDTPGEKDEGNRIQNLYQQFASERDREERGLDKKVATEVPRVEKPRTGNTIYVSGKTVTEDFLKKNFSEFGMNYI